MRHEVNNLDEVRVLRNVKLAASDWAMMPDAPTDKTAWAAYRQALRDFPATWTPGPVAEFPLAPGEEPAPTVEEVEAAPDAPYTDDVGGSDPDAISDGL